MFCVCDDSLALKQVTDLRCKTDYLVTLTTKIYTEKRNVILKALFLLLHVR